MSNYSSRRRYSFASARRKNSRRLNTTTTNINSGPQHQDLGKSALFERESCPQVRANGGQRAAIVDNSPERSPPRVDNRARTVDKPLEGIPADNIDLLPACDVELGIREEIRKKLYEIGFGGIDILFYQYPAEWISEGLMEITMRDDAGEGPGNRGGWLRWYLRNRLTYYLGRHGKR